jgi:hypothetical protein
LALLLAKCHGISTFTDVFTHDLQCFFDCGRGKRHAVQLGAQLGDALLRKAGTVNIPALKRDQMALMAVGATFASPEMQAEQPSTKPWWISESGPLSTSNPSMSSPHSGIRSGFRSCRRCL